jgi:hypothetical protein
MHRGLVGVALVATFAATSAAGVVLRVSPRELADAASAVVEGRVDAIDVRWNDDDTAINTWVTLLVDRVHKGTIDRSVKIKVPGGIVGDDEARVDGVARFEKGERCVVFLWRDRHGEYQVLGEAQGRFALADDGPRGARMAQNSLAGLCLMVRGGDGALSALSTTSPDRLPYDDLIAIVRASVAGTPSPTTTGSGPAVGSRKPDLDDVGDPVDSDSPAEDDVVTQPPADNGTTVTDPAPEVVGGTVVVTPPETSAPAPGTVDAPVPPTPLPTIAVVGEGNGPVTLRFPEGSAVVKLGTRLGVFAPDGSPRGVTLRFEPTAEEPRRAVRVGEGGEVKVGDQVRELPPTPPVDASPSTETLPPGSK